MPDNKDVIPLNFLQHLAPNYIEHSYSHLVENFYVHNTKSIDTTQVKRKCGRTQSKIRKFKLKLEMHKSCSHLYYMTPQKPLKFQAMTWLAGN